MASRDWDPVRPSVSDHLTRSVVDLVRSEGLVPGDRLPSVQALAERFNVAQPTVRESLRRLQAVGMLDIRHGSGIYLRRPTHAVILPNPHPGRLSDRTIDDLLGARLLIEPELAGLAARRISGGELQDLERVLGDAAQRLAGEERELGRHNMDFHRKVAELSGNTVLSEIIDSLLALHEDDQLVVMRLYNDRGRDHRQHRAIFGAIRARDPERARRTMREHLRDVRRVLSSRLSGGSEASP
ncbi:MAG TPA: FadR/GntR family transcriptional regulator [Candidatus Dormibacteraeota bacterium]|jgi:GntR family transcriptional repressor for pyruvate dehydrogenase complex|nr:FadR/GntR family transcriptional regulator [Candidatus Dormibacteraeota bacterium]